jgi:hypothetical protein
MNNDPVVKLILNYEKNLKRGACDIHAFFKNILEQKNKNYNLVSFTYPIFNYMIYPTSLSGKRVYSYSDD